MKRHKPRRLAAESLENRALLAGDITATVDGGVLRLVGDDAANGVLIRGTGENLEVVGTEAGGSPTTINGEASFTASGVRRGMAAWLGKGNDSIQLGDDGPVTIWGTVVVGLGDGNDTVSGSLKNGGVATFHLGPGADSLGLQQSTLGSLVVNGDPLANARGGNDDVSLDAVRVLRGALINTGGGDDSVKIGGGSTFPLGLTINTGDGADRVDLEGTADAALWVGNALNIFTGRGNDVVNAQHVTVRGVTTVTNLDGNATVTLDHVKATDGLFAWLGRGDDSLTIRNSSSARAGLGGGPGQDSLTLENNNFDRLNTHGFEN